jgi:hypothetical protein
MSDGPDRLLLLAVGRDDIVLQARYAAASALAWSEGEPIELRVYTDRPDAFAALGPRVQVEPVTPERLRGWRGRWDFLFRIKPALVQDALRAAPGRVLFVDADTYWKGPVAAAFARVGGGAAAMHAREYLVSTRDSGQMRRFRRRLARSRFRGAPVEADRWMWNSGAVGLDRAHLPLVQDWLDFVDEVFPTNPKPHVEQFGLSLVLQRAGVEIRPLDDLLVHYFDDKERHEALLPGRLAALEGLSPAEAARRVREDPPVPAGPRPPRRRRGFLERVRASLRQRLDLARAARRARRD